MNVRAASQHRMTRKARHQRMRQAAWRAKRQEMSVKWHDMARETTYRGAQHGRQVHGVLLREERHRLFWQQDHAHGGIEEPAHTPTVTLHTPHPTPHSPLPTPRSISICSIIVAAAVSASVMHRSNILAPLALRRAYSARTHSD